MGQKIKIYVSNRIDLDSVSIPNSIYVPVRCGAVYDKRENIKMLGDDTGDNISEKRESFCEFTVMYWAWKNQKADYYGLCHYRRFLSFADKFYDTKQVQGFVVEEDLEKNAEKKYSLLDKAKMKRKISDYDIVTSTTYPVSNLNWFPKPRNEREVWTNHPDIMIFEPDIDLLISVVDELFPMYSETIHEEIVGDRHRGFNCFVMKKQYFNQMCEFIFGVLFEMEKRVDYSIYGGKCSRVFGYMGEILYNTFMRWAISQDNIKVKETQIVFFKRTEKAKVAGYKKSIRRTKIKNIMQSILPSYRVSLRLERELNDARNQISSMKAIMEDSQKQITFMRTIMMKSFWFSEPKYPDNLNEIKQQFWDSYPGASGDLLLLQKSNTILLKKLKQICDQLGIKFWLHGGSLVGALRHKKCVPWDDDIDVAMMRSDLEKLMDYLADNEKYRIAEYYYCCFGCRSYRFMRKDIDVAFFVDIFPYDNYSLTTSSALDDWKKIRSYKERGLMVQYKQIVSKYGKLFNNFKLYDNMDLKNELDALIDAYIHKFKSDESAKYISWGMDNNYENPTRYAWHHGRIFKKSDIFPLKEAEYDGELYYIPANFKFYALSEHGLNYLDMPMGIGQAAHLNTHYKGRNIRQMYSMLKEDNEYREI